ncbi:histidinol dehydrogenase-domain-containing protein [Paraphysoderma sedebokerense]|nr:histidinol dehydrogenase-domain-containing protein [Paraphysoderma sedebokerense]
MFIPAIDVAEASLESVQNTFNVLKTVGNVFLHCSDSSHISPDDRVIPTLLDTDFSTSWINLSTNLGSTSFPSLLAAATYYLDHGAAKVVLSLDIHTSRQSITTLVDQTLSKLPADRLIIRLIVQDETCSNEKEILETISTLNPLVSGYVIQWPISVPPFDDVLPPGQENKELVATPKISFLRQLIQNTLKQLSAAVNKDHPRSLILSLPKMRPTVSLIGQLDKIGVDIVIPYTHFNLSTTKAEDVQPAGNSLLDLGEAISSILVTDRPDGLYPTVVVDEQGVALGLVYSSVQSISESIRTGQGVYQSRTRGIWYKGLTSGATQALMKIEVDCDRDTLRFVVHQHGLGFCHLNTRSCFGEETGLSALAHTLIRRKVSAPEGSYTYRLFNDNALLHNKIIEEANELVEAQSPDDIAWEAADLIYFALVKCVAAGLSLNDIDKQLNKRAKKITRRPGNAKPNAPFASSPAVTNSSNQAPQSSSPSKSPQVEQQLVNESLTMKSYSLSDLSFDGKKALLQRPIIDSTKIAAIVKPIVDNVRTQGDSAILSYTAKFDKVQLSSPVLLPPFAQHFGSLDPKVKQAIDTAYDNIYKFHNAQLEKSALVVETMPGITCKRFYRPIQRVGIYVPGGSAVLPSTTLMLGIPAKVAGCNEIVVATPPRSDGSICPEVLYVADKIGASMVLMAGGAQAVAAMAYGTETVSKVDKICGPGNQFVTAAKMMVQNDTAAMVSIDMPAGPSEVLVIADSTANPAFVASDLLSQAEHGPDSQVVLLTVDLNEQEIAAIEDQVEQQALKLPRVDIVKKSIPKSYIVRCKTMTEAIEFSNEYAPEHLILQIQDAEKYVDSVENAGSIFVGHWSPESCGDYASGTNHTLPTYGYARMYSGVNTHTFVKHITSQQLSKEGLEGIAECVMTLANVEGLDAHARAVGLRVGKEY